MSVAKIDTMAFVVDTKQYAGNFERQMCAYVTGEIGECGAGEGWAQLFEEEHPDMVEDGVFRGFMDHLPDDHGCRRPVSIWLTPGFFNDGMGKHYPDSTPVEEVHANYDTSVGHGWDGRKYPAYQSVAMFMASSIDTVRWEFMKERARKFAELYAATPLGSKIEIIGFRLLHIHTAVDDCLPTQIDPEDPPVKSD